MKKMKLILNESLISNKDSDILEDISAQQKPDYQIIDVTVIPDEDYYPTIQSILIDLDESNRLVESDGTRLDINILSETVNQKTNYSNSLFEFESKNHTITLSLVLQETERKGIYKVEAYTTKGIKVFESNTYKPRMIIESYLNSLAGEYLIDKPLKEGYSLGDDKESFKVWEEEESKLKKVYDYVTAGNREDLKAVMDTVEHSQDNIHTAAVTIKGLKEEDLAKEDNLTNLYSKYPFINNIQVSKWYGDDIVCFIDFDISGAASDRRLDIVIRTCLEEFFGPDYLNYPNIMKESDEDIKRDLNIEPGSDEEAMLDELYEEPENPRDYAEDEPFPDEGQNITDNSDYSPEEFIQAMNISNEVYDLPIDYSEWNNMSQEERFDLIRPEMTKFVNKYKNTFDKNPQIFDLVQYNLTDANFHTEAKVMRDLYKGGE